MIDFGFCLEPIVDIVTVRVAAFAIARVRPFTDQAMTQIRVKLVIAAFGEGRFSLDRHLLRHCG